MTFTSILFLIILHFAPLVHSLGSSSTIAATFATATVCGIVAGEPTQRIQCYRNGHLISVQPNVSFEAISAGFTFFCALRSGGFSVFCWETLSASNSSSFHPRRIYNSNTVRLTDLAVGDDQVCAREVNSGEAKCWRGKDRGGSLFPLPGAAFKFTTLTSGSGFTCGILRNSNKVYCWGINDVGDEIWRQFGNFTMLNIVAGKSHACGLTSNGSLVCKGRNEGGELDVPFNSAFEFSGLALASDFSCAIGQSNGLVKCWGRGADKFLLNGNVSGEVPFELIVAGMDFMCGLSTRNLSMICWGQGWSQSHHAFNLPLGMMIPGPCVQSSCTACGLYPNSELLCYGSGNICKSCRIELPFALPLPPTMPPPSQPLPSSLPQNKYSLAFLVFGSVGSFAGFCTIIYCLYNLLKMRSRNQNLVQPSATNAHETATSVTTYGSTPATPSLKSFSARRYGSRRLGSSSGTLGRQRSESSSKHLEKTQDFLLAELVVATNNFSAQSKIGAGSFGSVYKGVLADGRLVAIKRGEKVKKMKKFQEKESAFESELALLSRLHHKHLVNLIGFCEEMDERLLVYEFMSNGSLHDHLHRNKSSILNSWRMRIKIALDAARGIEYLHNYAVPPIIHRDIKSSNILLDVNLTAKVSDFGLSLKGPETDREFMSAKAAGTVGYIDPEYYVMNVLTAKSDVYGLGVVMLELLTGKKAVFKKEEEGSGPIEVVEYAAPLIAAGKMQRVLDKRVSPAAIQEVEAVEIMAYTAVHCVNLEGKERPNIMEIVANLERAIGLCDGSPGRVSSSTYSTIPSD
ncbi:putative serine/threonine-protein kinase-like protein CCR3 [Mercurialis annua]|uniref:putative serine/threonine-protein kinase-like protein CCR3 n=1 Tax=Mercurialis annua TaxID=3986 RepID=UPI00215DE750|nr:putative serine/threonine-protein kinase-like protein CCR3 [Mercurialis annua]